MRYAISKYKDNPPVPLPYCPIYKGREIALAETESLNQLHRAAGTGKLFKMFEVKGLK